MQAVQEHLAQVTSLLDETADLQQRASGLLPATQQDEEALHNALMDALNGDGSAGTWEDAEGNIHFPLAAFGAKAAAQEPGMEDDAPVDAEDRGHVEQPAGAVSKEAGASGSAPEEHMEFEDAYEELTHSFATVPFPTEGRDIKSSHVCYLLQYPCGIPGVLCSWDRQGLHPLADALYNLWPRYRIEGVQQE